MVEKNRSVGGVDLHYPRHLRRRCSCSESPRSGNVSGRFPSYTARFLPLGRLLFDKTPLGEVCRRHIVFRNDFFNFIFLLPIYPAASAFAATRILAILPFLAGIFLVLQKSRWLRLFGVLALLIDIAVFFIAGFLFMSGR